MSDSLCDHKMILYDGRYFSISRSLPPLPNGVIWHVGMLVTDDIDSHVVESVCLNLLDGSVNVYLEGWDAFLSEEQIPEFIENGWTVLRRKAKAMT